MFDATVLTVLIASPSDCVAEREAVRDAVLKWNDRHSTEQLVMLAPWMWESNAAPAFGSHPQVIINEQSTARDIVLGVFHARLGTPTADYASGTVEEVLRAHGDGKEVSFFFWTGALPSDHDVDQWSKLSAFKSSVSGQGLHGDYDSLETLKDVVWRALDRMVAKLRLVIDARPDPTSQGLSKLRDAGIQASRVRVYFERLPGRPANEGLMRVHNYSDSNTIHNLTILEGRLAYGSPNGLARFGALSDADQSYPAVSPRTSVQIVGRWTIRSGMTSSPYEPTEEELRSGCAEMYWTDDADLVWTTDNPGGIAELQQ